MIHYTHTRSLFALSFSSLLAAAACGPNGDESAGSHFKNTDGTWPEPTVPEGEFDTEGLGGIPPPDAACAVAEAEAEITPVNLVVMFDRSGSMGDTNEDPSFDPRKRWIPVKKAMKAFFADPGSAAMRAQLTFFPSAKNSCKAADYETPAVSLTPLPSAVFAEVLDRSKPCGDTPTRAAARGAVTQAAAIAQGSPSEATVVILVTDGEPYGCGVHTVAQSNAEASRVAADVATVRSTIPTYVVGVGPSVQNLDAVAQAGGTTAFHVRVGNPEQTSEELLATLTTIRGDLARCDVDVPPAPDGRTLDPNKVNVEVTAPGKPTSVLPHDEACEGGVGWHWDDATAPTKVLLCPATCEEVKVQAGGKVNVAFGCVDRPDVIK